MTTAELNHPPPMRILMLAACPFPWPRGTPVRIQRLAQALVEEGHTVDVLTYHLGKASDGLPFKVYRIANVFYYNRVTAGPSISKLVLLNPMLVRSLLKRGKSGDYDIIHAHHIEGVMVALAARSLGLNLPIIYDAHTLVGSELLDYGPAIGAGIKRSVGSFLDHRYARRADSVIAVTDSIKAEFVKRDSQPDDRVYVIPNGIEEDFIERAAAARAASAASEASTESVASATEEEMTEDSLVAEKFAPLFMFAGNTAAYQRIDLMLKAFALVVQKLPKARLAILSSESIDVHRGLISSLGIADKVSLSDVELEDLPGMLVTADVLLNPRTRCAGIPQKLLNYMAAGRPVVSFAGSAKIVRHRIDGLVIENENVQAYADAMLELVFDPELGKKLSKAGIESMCNHYSWRSAARKTLTVYSDTLSAYSKK